MLRGPASSLYGNVALTAVVNIITKKGKDINGVKGKYGLGSYGTHRADLIAGFGSDILNIMAWASIYTSQGEMYRIPEGTGYSATPHDGYAYIGRYEGKPSYDLGFTLKVNDFKLMMSRKYGKQVPQYSYYGEVYDYDRYRKLGGNKSGYSIDETHLDLGYEKDLGKFHIDASVYGDWYTIDDYSVLSDSTMNIDFNRDGSAVKTPEGKYVYRLYHGMFQDLLWKEYTIGAIAKADYEYKLGSMKGNILVGAQYELFTLDANDTHLGENYEEMTMVKPESQYTIRVGRERSVSGFLQVKHVLIDSLIINAGLRYDNKYRKNEEYVTAFSPRVALIYTPTKLFNTKISYSRAFVDAPYLYRQNTTSTYKGSANLMPEYLNAFQLDFMGDIGKENIFSYDVNLFFNYMTDIITNNQSTDVNAPKYINAGTLKIAGVEAALGYSRKSFHARANATWQRALSAEQYTYSDHEIYSVPSVIANLTCEKRLFPWKNEKANDSKHSLWLSGNLQYTSRTLNKANSRVKGSSDFYLSDRALVDLRLKYDYNEMMQLSIDCDNVFNTTYEIGGTSYLPYRYPGRIVMGTIAFKL